jgi:hypothetical protein
MAYKSFTKEFNTSNELDPILLDYVIWPTSMNESFETSYG